MAETPIIAPATNTTVPGAPIFISYRREDSANGARLLANALREHYDESAVFFDTRSIEVGSNWPDDLAAALAAARVVLVLVGKHWFVGDPVFNGKRIDDDQYWVHREVSCALNSVSITTIPVLLNIQAPPPQAFLVPLRPLSELQAFPFVPTIRTLTWLR